MPKLQPKPAKDQHINLFMPLELIIRVDKVASKSRLNRSEAMRQLLDYALKRAR